MSEIGIHDHGYWYGDVSSKHLFDASLAGALVLFFKSEQAQTIIDMGCGMAEYIKWMRSNGLCCEGYDGNPDTFELTEGLAKVADLSQLIILDRPFDWVLNLEVGEHIPKQYEKIFIENLDRHNKKGIVLSWAIKGQGGSGHFNEQDNLYIKKRISQLGYINDLKAENELRNSASLWYFKDTIMVFRKDNHFKFFKKILNALKNIGAIKGLLK